ncbi:hypothetical protein F4678DRAFT_243805 [Xylaria arbuscula]|nr:hypothetical protein F4678DRAFT_243805 [Xylaria arbuscula]
MTILPPDPYRVLGVSKDAQIPEIRSAHRKLVLKCHPDKIQDPALKEAKQIEFQQVQQAYELLSNELEREKYDRRAEVYEHAREREREREKAKTSAARTTSSTPKGEPIFYHVKEASPRATTFAKSSPYGRTPPRSWEDQTSSRLFEEATRHARKTASYEKEKPSKRDEERRKRKEDEEWAREREKAKERELRDREAREARKARERKEEKDRAARDREEREKEKRKEEKKKSHSDREKEREKERKSASAEKHRSRHVPIIEESSDAPDSSDDDVVYEPAPKTDRNKSGSSRRPEDIDPPTTSDRDRKYSGNIETALRYLNKSGAKAPVSFSRSHTYTEGTSSAMYATPMVPTPPPAPGAPFAPPPPVNEPDELSEDEVVRRSSARTSSRRMSHDTPRSSREKPSSHKKPSSSRDQPIIVEAGSPRTVPTFSRAHTESYARPVPVPGLGRAETWYAKTDREHERSRSRVTPPMYTEDEDSEDDRERRHRRSRRTQSPEAIPHTRYAVDGSGTKSIPIRQKQYHEQPARGAYKTSKAYVMPNSSARVQRGNKAYNRDYYEEDQSQHYSGVKYAAQFDERDIRYSDLPYKGSYRPDIYA